VQAAPAAAHPLGSGARGGGWVCARALLPERPQPFLRRPNGSDRGTAWPCELLCLPTCTDDGVVLLAPWPNPGLPGLAAAEDRAILAVGTRVRVSHPAMDGYVCTLYLVAQLDL
jgi:hypothetical protein